MPCSDGNYGRDVVYAKGYDPMALEEIKRLEKRLDLVTQLLCAAGKARHNKTNIPAEVLSWWDEHCKLDKSKGEPW